MSELLILFNISFLHFILLIFLKLLIKVSHIKFSFPFEKKSAISSMIVSDNFSYFDNSLKNILLFIDIGNLLIKSF